MSCLTAEPTFQTVCNENKSNVYISLLSSQNVISDGSEECNTGINATWEYNAQGVYVLFLNFFLNSLIFPDQQNTQEPCDLEA